MSKDWKPAKFKFFSMENHAWRIMLWERERERQKDTPTWEFLEWFFHQQVDATQSRSNKDAQQWSPTDLAEVGNQRWHPNQALPKVSKTPVNWKMVQWHVIIFPKRERTEVVGFYQHTREREQTYLECNKTINADIGVWEFSTPDVKQHENQWHSQKWGPQPGDGR